MRAASLQTLLPTGWPSALPLRLEQRSCSVSNALMLLLIVPVALALLYPFVLLAGHSLSNAGRSAFLAHPAALAPILTGLAFWAVLFAWPILRLAHAFARRRTVAIDGVTATVVEHTPLGSRGWQEPIEAFRGVAHQVRASLSGVRHELILVHPDQERSILVAVAPRIEQSEIDRICALLGRVEISSRELYRAQFVPFGLAPSAVEASLAKA